MGSKSEDLTNVSPNSELHAQQIGYAEDTRLRRIEINVKIPQKMRDKARLEKCVDLVTVFNDCAKRYGLGVVTMCRKENEIMKECLGYWYNNEEFFEECKKEYLAERAYYRRTGEPVKKYRVRKEEKE